MRAICFCFCMFFMGSEMDIKDNVAASLRKLLYGSRLEFQWPIPDTMIGFMTVHAH